MLFKGLFILVAKSSPLLPLISFYFQGSLFIAGSKIDAETCASLAKVYIKGTIKAQMMKHNKYVNTQKS